MPAHFETDILGDHIVIRVRKKLDASSLGEFAATWKEAINPGLCRVILDLSGLDFLDSSGIGAIVTMRNSILSRKGKLIVLNGPNNICRVFDITGMRSKFESYDDPEEAVRKVLS